MILNERKSKHDEQKMNGLLFKQQQLRKHYNLAMLFCKRSLSIISFVHCLFSHCRAVRNLYQLVLRQQKIDKEEDTEEIEDPIKRVRQQLEKVRSTITFLFINRLNLYLLGSCIHS